jgi:hypothetical protein
VLTRRRTSPVNDWIHRLVFEDPELQPLWSTVIGLRDEASLVPASNAAIRRRVDSLTATVETAFSPVAARLRLSFLAALQLPRARAIERERAIAEELRQRRARLASSLLQPGLFDRRTEHAATAQNATLDEALDRCARRLAELSGYDAVTIDRRLACGLVRR